MAAEKQGRWGFLDMQGRVLLPFDYQLPISAAEGRIWVHRDSISILLDNQFREISRFSKYNRVYPFSNGYAAVSIKDTSDYYGNLYGYIDSDGHEVVATQFDGVAYDANPYGISVVGKKSYGIVGQYIFNIQERGVIDEQRYSNLKRFGPLLFNSYGDFLSSKTGRPIENFPYPSINPLTGDRRDLAMVRREGKVGLVDTTLTELFPLEYDDISSFHQNRVKIKKSGRWGFADEQYRIRIPMMYDDVYYFRYPMLTEVTQNKKKGVIDRYGQEIIPLYYTRISFDYVCDRIYAEKSDGIDIYDKEGQLLHSTDFEYIAFYGRNHYVVYRQNGKMGFMDYDFNILHKPEFDGVGSFYDGLAWVALNGKGGYINEQFQLVIPVQYDDIENFAIGLAKVKK